MNDLYTAVRDKVSWRSIWNFYTLVYVKYYGSVLRTKINIKLTAIPSIAQLPGKRQPTAV
jgi:hypothetical protein